MPKNAIFARLSIQIKNRLAILFYEQNIDLFSGAGGFSLGFDSVGFENVFSIDKAPLFCKTYQHNFPHHLLIEKDICNLTNKEIATLKGAKKVDVVIGGPPCQGFSIAGNIGRKFIDDPRNKLFKEFVRVVKVVQPNFFVLENVARLYTHNKGKTRQEIIKDFEKLGYTVACQILNAADYGVPKVRKRVIFIGSLQQQNIIFPEKEVENYVSVKTALESYPILSSGETSSVPNHKAMRHSEQMLTKMSYISDGGNRSEIPLAIRPKSGDVRKYIKYASDMPSVCVTGDMRKIFHYNQNRALTVRELAKLQSFPDNFIFQGGSLAQQQQVGNAVPPKMAAAIAKVIIKMSENV